MHVIRCDGCGKEVSDEEILPDHVALGIVVNLRVGTSNHEAHVCSLECLTKASVEKLMPRAIQTFERLTENLPHA